MKKFGFLGGSFDPIHFGHIHLGISLQEAHGLDEVILCPAFQSPLKQEQPIKEEHRLAMLKLAVEDLPSWSVVDWELKRKQPSFTIDTIRFALKNIFSKEKVELYLLLGEDLLPELPQWKEAHELLELAPPLIGCRKPAEFRGSLDFQEKILTGMTVTNILEISATEVRQRLKNGLYCGHLVPAKVLDYIRLHHLYSSI